VRSLVYPPAGLPDCWTDLPGETPLPDSILAALPDDSTGYPISRALGGLLARLILAGRRSVLELGAGSSLVVVAQSLSLMGGGRLTSLEQLPEWCREAWSRVAQTPRVDSHLEATAPRFRFLRSGPCHVYSSAAAIVRSRGPYDLMLVDAPQWYYGRDGAMPLALDALSPGALVVIDDASRHQERWAIRRWLRVYPGLTMIGFLPAFGRNGVAVLRFSGDRTRRFSIGAWMSGAVHSGVGWMVRSFGQGQAGETPHLGGREAAADPAGR